MDPQKKGWITAVDADSGAVKWRYQAATPMVAGITVTGSGLILTADLNGDFLALDAATGNVVHRIPTSQPVGGGVITYQSAGQQRIALAAGMNSLVFGTKGQPTVLVFGL
jgi:alcohol dehydrogenase (cytochrome c)